MLQTIARLEVQMANMSTRICRCGENSIRSSSSEEDRDGIPPLEDSQELFSIPQVEIVENIPRVSGQRGVRSLGRILRNTPHSIETEVDYVGGVLPGRCHSRGEMGLGLSR